jgi:hypothetical protein
VDNKEKVVLFLLETNTFCVHFNTWWAPARILISEFTRQFEDEISAFY